MFIRFTLIQFLEVNTTSEHLLLLDLIPYTAYFVVIKCIPSLNSNVKGFWSNNTTIRFTTLEDGLYDIHHKLSGLKMIIIKYIK